VDVTFTNGVVEGLPFPGEHFDTVLSTLMLHHLPRAAREQCVREIRRVLKPGGRVLAVDFGGTTGGRKSFIEHFHRHGRVDVHDIIKLLSEAGLEIIESGPVGVRDLNFVLATA
jgi:ubiquinone/menaquinone biosynthesis C-methylase UbiE